MTDNSKDIRNTFGGIAEQYHQLRRRIEKIERSPADLRNAAIDGGRGLTIKSDAETIRFGDNGVEHLEGPDPEQPEAPFVDLGGESVKVQLSGLDAYGYPAQRNFKQAHIHVSQDDVFEPSRGTFAGYVAQADGSMTHRLPGGEWYVGVVWENMSGTLSPMSDTTLADVEPLVDTGDIQDALDEAQERLDTYRDEVAAPRFQALETGLETNTTNLDDARTRLSEAESTLSPLPGRIETAEQDVETAKEAAVEAGAAAVEANNRAMTRLANGNFESGLDYWAYQNVTLSSTAHSGTQSAHLAEGGLYPASSFPVVAGQIWELSLYHQGSATVVFESVTDNDRATLDTLTLTGSSGTWADSGALRITVPANVDLLGFTISAGDALVDDITLRDVTDVVRLEEAANANRQKAEQAISELAVLQLAVDGEGGLKDRLTDAETVLETKANTAALDQLDQKLAGNLAAFEAHYTRIWRQPTPPPPGTHYAWLGEPHDSVSVRLDGDGNETARNLIKNGAKPRNNTSTPSVSYDENGYIQFTYADDSLGGGYATMRLDIDRPTEELEGEIVTMTYEAKSSNGRGSSEAIIGNRQGGYNESMGTMSGEFSTFSGTQEFRENGQWLPHLRFFNDEAGVTYTVRHVKLEIGDQVVPYWDGDTESDRAHDLWYNAEGVPHEWVNGTGWTPISDARITELASTVSAHADRLQTAETELGKKATTSALNALAGNVTANQTAIGETKQALEDAQDDLDTALTGPVDHDRLRAGEGAFNQAFIARLVADSVSAMSAEFANLTVTEKANFAQIIGDQIWAELAVFDRLDAREAYVGGAHLKDGAVTAEKMTITGDLAAAIVSADKARIAELISDEIWAELGVFDRLEAREGWVGGVNLADGAVTAEKIHATREMVTKIMGAEWAYIAQQLIVDGSILTRDLEALSAAIQSLTVTQRADIAELWAEELWTALAVIEELQTEEAWITSAMIEELTAEKVTVTQNFVGRVAEFLHLVVDRIDVNKLWADTTWQAAGHFGSESADQSTTVDGTGLRITRHDAENEASTDLVRLGGEGIGLTFSDEDGQITGSISHEGDASFRDLKADALTVSGRGLLPAVDPAPFWDGNLWDSQPKGLICFHEANMAGQNVNHVAYGFIEVSHHVRANRRYRVSISNVRLSGSGTYYGHFKYTLGDQPSAPHTESPRLGQSWFLRNTATSGVSAMNDHVFTPEHDGLIRILFVVEGASAGIEFSGISGYNQVQMRLEDLGPNRPYTGMTRTAGHGGSGTIRDPQPLTGSITTEWDMTWFQNYSNGGTIKRSSSDNRTGYGSAGLTQGVREFGAGGDGIWNSIFGFTTSTSSTNASDQGVTLPAALNGAEPIAAYLEVQNMLGWHPDKNTQFPIGYHSHTSAPAQFTGYTQIQDTRIQEGTTARIPVPLDLINTLGRAGNLTGFAVTTTSTTSRYAGILSWNNRPKLVVTYQR